MKISELTYENVTPIIEGVVDDYGWDYVFYEACRYFTDTGEPQCLVGHVFHRMGVELPDTIPNVLGNDIDTNTAIVARIFQTENGDQLLGEALGMAQLVQDGKKSWGQALDRYLDVLHNNGEAA